MALVNKSFKNNQTGEIVKIIDSYQNIAITENKEKIDANRLMDNRYYTEYIDPNSFFSQDTYNVFAEKIKNLDLSKLPQDDENIEISSIYNTQTNESAVVIYDPEEEKEELRRKYGATDMTELKKQNDAFAKILQDEVQDEVKTMPEIKKSPESVNQLSRWEDPIITMFKNAKRNVEFSVKLEIYGKIPRIDFIEMMEDSYEVSIIEFLADEFTNDLLKNPNKIKTKIIEEIKNRVYPKIEKTNTSSLVEPVNVIETSTQTNQSTPLGVIEPKPKSTRGRKKQESK